MVFAGSPFWSVDILNAEMGSEGLVSYPIQPGKIELKGILSVETVEG